MPATEQLTIELPTSTLDLVRSRVAAGEYASEGEMIASALATFLFRFDDLENSAFLEECARRYDKARGNPASLLSLDEAFAGLIRE